MTDQQSFGYIEVDIVPGVTINDYRRARAIRRSTTDPVPARVPSRSRLRRWRSPTLAQRRRLYFAPTPTVTTGDPAPT